MTDFKLEDLYTKKEIDKLLQHYTYEQIYNYSKPVEFPVGALKGHIDKGEEVYVTSPDGLVQANRFVDKGQWEEYQVSYEGKKFSVNQDHLFQTPTGWELTKYLYDRCEYYGSVYILGDDGEYKDVEIIKTGKMIPIVDIQIDHPNHRYYTEGLSSHNTNVGKSAMMTFLASEFLKQGLNVLYISLEMDEESIFERVDANLMNINTDGLKNLSKQDYLSKVAKVKEKTNGRFYAKQYPTSSAHAGHFRHLIKELAQKKKFKPDFVFIDYINICASSRYKTMNGVNSYSYIKAIAEEIRGLAVEFDLPIMTATQINREGMNNQSPDMTSTSECLALDSIVQLRDGVRKELKDVKVGDEVKSHDGYKVVRCVHHSKTKKAYRIKTKSGKVITCSADHVFPTQTGRLSINNGLKVGSKINS